MNRHPICAGWDNNINTGEGYSQYTFKSDRQEHIVQSDQSNLGPSVGTNCSTLGGDPGDRTTVGYGTDAFWVRNLLVLHGQFKNIR